MNEQRSCFDEVRDAFPFELPPLLFGSAQFWCHKGFPPWLIVAVVVFIVGENVNRNSTQHHPTLMDVAKALNESETTWIAGYQILPLEAGRWARRFGGEIDLEKWGLWLAQLRGSPLFSDALVAFTFGKFALGELKTTSDLTIAIKDFDNLQHSLDKRIPEA